MPRVPARVSSVGTAQVVRTQSTGALGVEQSSNRQQTSAQRLGGASTASARGSLIGDHNVIAGVVLVANAAKSFNHLLGRMPQGAYPVLVSGSTPAKTCVISFDARIVTVKADANATVDWLVF